MSIIGKYKISLRRMILMDSKKQDLSIIDGKCPLCRGQLYEGPHGSDSMNMMCGRCNNEFGVHGAIGIIFDMGKTDRRRRFDAYDGVPEVKQEIIDLGLFRSINWGFRIFRLRQIFLKEKKKEGRKLWTRQIK